MKKGLTFKVPNTLIQDGALGINARRLGIVLFSRRNVRGSCCKSVKELATLACCCEKTVRDSLEALERGGYITRKKRLRVLESHGYMVNGKNRYTCNTDLFTEGYTFLPRSMFQHVLKAKSFLLLAYLYFQAGNDPEQRSFPSLSKMQEKLGLSRSTVCVALRDLKMADIIYVQHCIDTNGGFDANSYFFLNRLQAEEQGTKMSTAAKGRGAISKVQTTFYIGPLPQHLPSLLPPLYMRFTMVPRRWKPPFSWGSPLFTQL